MQEITRQKMYKKYLIYKILKCFYDKSFLNNNPETCHSNTNKISVFEISDQICILIL